MARHRNLCMPLVLLTAVAASAACNAGPSVNGTFDRNYNVTGPIRLEITNASGDVDITGSSDGKVHVRGDVRASGFGFDNPQKRLDETVANPPIGQTGDTIRIGKEISRMRNVSIAYSIQVPRDTEVSATVASGRVFVQGNPGADNYWELKTASGVVQLAVPASANLHISAEAVSGEIRSDIPIVVEEQGKHSLRAHMGSGGGRVDIHTVSGEIRITGTK